MFNKIILVGRISTNLELKYTGSNKPYCKFNVAVSKNFVNQDGERETNFISVTLWNKQAENLCQYQSKGSLILVEGSIDINNYIDKDGNNRTSFDVTAQNVQYLGSKRNESIELPENTEDVESSDPYAEMGEQVSIDDNFLD